MKVSQVVKKTLLIFGGIFALVIGLFLIFGMVSTLKEQRNWQILEFIISFGLVVSGVSCFVIASKAK